MPRGEPVAPESHLLRLSSGVPALLCLAGILPLAGQVPAGHSSLVGRVVTSDGHPISGARIVRFGATDTTRADTSGHFAVEHLALGRHIFVVRQPGYQSIEMEVSFTSDTTVSIDVPLESSRTAGTATLDRVGFTERRRRAGAGSHDASFVGPEEIAAKGAARTTQLLAGLPDITIRTDGQIDVVYGFDKRCIMNVWLDGQHAENVFPPMQTTSSTQTSGAGAVHSTYTGLDVIIRPEQIAAIEVYSRPSRVPAQFQVNAAGQMVSRGLQYETHTSDCGAIVIWSNQE